MILSILASGFLTLHEHEHEHELDDPAANPNRLVTDTDKAWEGANCAAIQQAKHAFRLITLLLLLCFYFALQLSSPCLYVCLTYIHRKLRE